MGLFWGSKKEKTMPPPQQREMTLHEKLTQPLEIGYVTGSGPANASPEFGYIIRRMDDSVYKNNCIVREIRDLVRGLAEENQSLKQRVEQLEQQVSKNR